jgi:hypothetical protein
MTIYIKGRRKEYKIIYDERAKGRIAFRSAGSHSPIDVVSIDIKNKTIFFIQSKRTLNKRMSYIDETIKNKLMNDEQLKQLNNTYDCSFIVL